MKVPRTYRGFRGTTRSLSDEQLVSAYLDGYVDQYSGGMVEQLEVKVQNISRNLAEILLALDKQKVLDICEEKE